LKKGGIAMSKKVFAILLAIVLASLLETSSMTNEATAPAELERFYSAYIDNFISNCETKEGMRDSTSECISQEAALYCLKACFLKGRKDELIARMIAEDVGTNPDKVHYHLNSAFFEVLRKAIKSRKALQYP
jgi:hypothetical protein